VVRNGFRKFLPSDRLLPTIVSSDSISVSFKTPIVADDGGGDISTTRIPLSARAKPNHRHGTSTTSVATTASVDVASVSSARARVLKIGRNVSSPKTIAARST
jgi:hypothetical protein